MKWMFASLLILSACAQRPSQAPLEKILPVSQDTVLRYERAQAKLYVIDRYRGAISIYKKNNALVNTAIAVVHRDHTNQNGYVGLWDTATANALDFSNYFSLEGVLSTGEGSNPYDVVNTDSSVWIARFLNRDLVQFDPSRGKDPLQTLRFDSPTDVPVHLVQDGKYVFVLKQKLSVGKTPMPTDENGRIEVRDAKTFASVKTVALPGKNPTSRLKPCGNQYCVSTGDWMSKKGGISEFDPRKLTAVDRFLISEKQLNGNILSFDTHDGVHFFISTTSDFKKFNLIYLDAKKHIPELVKSVDSETGWTFNQVSIHPVTQDIYVCDRSFSNEFGIRIFDGRNLTQEKVRIVSALPPESFVWIE